jgi:hypothetical protein
VGWQPAGEAKQPTRDPCSTAQQLLLSTRATTDSHKTSKHDAPPLSGSILNKTADYDELSTGNLEISITTISTLQLAGRFMMEEVKLPSSRHVSSRTNMKVTGS